MNLKQSLLGNNFEALRTLPNFNKIQDELNKLETQMFICADKNYFDICVNVSHVSKISQYRQGFNQIDLTNLTQEILEIFCAKHDLYIEDAKINWTETYRISWVKDME